MAKVLRQVSFFNGTKLITNMPKFITLNCHIYINQCKWTVEILKV